MYAINKPTLCANSKSFYLRLSGALKPAMGQQYERQKVAVQLSVFVCLQVETIGDAYCVACGLHKQSKTHAQQIAWMALKMIDTCSYHQTHEGQPIRVSRYLNINSTEISKEGFRINCFYSRKLITC